jgi:hypothetical protein
MEKGSKTVTKPKKKQWCLFVCVCNKGTAMGVGPMPEAGVVHAADLLKYYFFTAPDS